MTTMHAPRRLKCLVRAIVIAVAAPGFGGSVVHVQLDTTPSGRQCPGEATLIVQDLGGDGERRITVSSTQTEASIPLRGERATVRLAAPGCWSEPTPVASGGQPAVLRLVRAAEIGGTLEVDRGRWPGRLRVWAFRPPDVGGSAVSASDFGHPLDCVLLQPKWQCVVPADTQLDVLLAPDDFAPVYFWRVAAAPGQRVTLEPRRLLAGSSLAGFVGGPDGKPLPGARLLLSSAGRLPFAATTNDHGYFELTGLQPGKYRLESRAEGLSPVLLSDVDIENNTQIVWPRSMTIYHRPLAAVEGRITPALNDRGKPWKVSLQPRLPVSDAERVLRIVAGRDGTWRADHLRADEYQLTIENASGAIVETLQVDLSPGGTVSVPITLH
jgi:hypothetical protein